MKIKKRNIEINDLENDEKKLEKVKLDEKDLDEVFGGGSVNVGGCAGMRVGKVSVNIDKQTSGK